MKNIHKLIALVILLLSSFGVGAQDLPEPTILDLDWHPTEDWLVIADTDGARIIDTITREVIQSIPVETTPIYAAAWSPDGSLLASGGVNGSLELWDIHTGEWIADLLGHDGIVNTIAWSADGSLLASNSSSFDGGFLITWDTSTYQPIVKLRVGNVTQISWSPDNQHLIAAMRNAGGAVAFDSDLIPESPQTYRIVSNAYFDGLSVDIHPTDNLMAFAAADGSIYVVDIEQDTVIRTLQEDDTDFLTRVKWSNDGNLLASVGLNGKVVIWDANTGDIRQTIDQPNPLSTVEFSPDGTQLAYGGENGVVPIISTIVGDQTQ